MNLSPSRRAATAWMLCLCILSNLAACAIAHGQSSGLQLSGSGLFCSADGHHGAGFADDLAEEAAPGALVTGRPADLVHLQQDHVAVAVDVDAPDLLRVSGRLALVRGLVEDCRQQKDNWEEIPPCLR